MLGNKLKAGEIIHLFNTIVHRIARSCPFVFPAVHKCSFYLCVIAHMHLPLFFCVCARSEHTQECAQICRVKKAVCKLRYPHIHAVLITQSTPPPPSPQSVCPQVLFPLSSLLTLLSLPCVPAVLIPSQAGRP